MTLPKPVLLLEFNELSPTLMDRLIGEGKLPNFERLRAESHVLVSDAEEEPPRLEPWIQWVTVHSGLSYAEHGVFRLGDPHKVKVPRIWDLVSDAGMRSWVCGSMNAQHAANLDGCVLPDPWTTDISPRPLELERYYRFVQTHVQEYTADSVPLRLSDHARFVGFMVRHGLSAETTVAIGRQLLAERREPVRWKRAAILDKLQWDVFRHYYRRLSPQLSTFFLNSTAHMQHIYWRNMEPKRFDVKPTEEEQHVFADAIEFGYLQMDGLVEKFLDLAGDDASIVFATALSQQPCTRYEAAGGKVIYKAHGLDDLLAFAGVEDGFRTAPVMAEEFHVYFDNEEAAKRGAEALGALRIGDRQVVTVSREGSSVYAGCNVHEIISEDSELVSATGATARFGDQLYLVDLTKSGVHHPDGMLWIRRPGEAPRVHSDKVSLRAIAPTILSMLDVPIPPSMTGQPLL